MRMTDAQEATYVFHYRIGWRAVRTLNSGAVLITRTTSRSSSSGVSMGLPGPFRVYSGGSRPSSKTETLLIMPDGTLAPVVQPSPAAQAYHPLLNPKPKRVPALLWLSLAAFALGAVFTPDGTFGTVLAWTIVGLFIAWLAVKRTRSPSPSAQPAAPLRSYYR
jgi:hypothetical protein